MNKPPQPTLLILSASGDVSLSSHFISTANSAGQPVCIITTQSGAERLSRQSDDDPALTGDTNSHVKIIALEENSDGLLDLAMVLRHLHKNLGIIPLLISLLNLISSNPIPRRVLRRPRYPSPPHAQASVRDPVDNIRTNMRWR